MKPGPADVIGALGALSVIIGIFIAIFVGVLWPLMALSVTLNIRRIRRALEQLAEIHTTGGSDTRPGRLGL